MTYLDTAGEVLHDDEKAAIDRLMHKMDEWMLSVPLDQANEMERKAKIFTEHLRETYPNYDTYKLYEVLAGGSIEPTYINYDFPGDDSIEKFIEENYSL